ncbi:MAG TPA: ATP synthase F1 subunit delta [Bryobacteraceae bacterium]|nr:ATP synthase F1 subunit delta [Bryobacteraceae bacterium]
MTSSAIAHRYAGALVDVVTGPTTGLDPQQVARELRDFQSVLAESVELRLALVSPSVPGSRKKSVVARLAERLALSRVTRNFLYILIDHRRIPALTEITEAFEMELDERLGFARAEVAAAHDLEQRQREALARSLEQLTGKRVRLKFSVDPALIGGVVARIGSTVYDGSVRGQLRAMGRRLAAE